MKNEERRTEDHDIEDKNDEANKSTSTSVFPSVTMVVGDESFLGHGKREERELHKHTECVLEHCYWR